MYDYKPYLQKIDRVIAAGKYKDNWASLQQYQPPEWYRQMKFGIFIHWGLYSLAAHRNEWYSRNMYLQGSPEFEHHRATYGPQDQFGYKDFIPLFRGEKFSADAWAELFEQAGAQYVVPVAEHHDGFQMYRSEISHWNAYEMGPRRDVLGELNQAFAQKGLVGGASSHRVEHWFFMGHGKEFASDIRESMERGDFYWPAMPEPDHQDLFSRPAPSQEFLEDWLVRTCEIIDRYRPKILYFDWWIQHQAVKPYLKKLAAYYYNRGEEWGTGAVINYKHDAFVFGTAVPDVERGQFAQSKPYLWQTDTSVALNSWGYTEHNRYRTAAELLQDLADIVSKNGRLLLNIGPKADGTIPSEDSRILREMGQWLKVNGEAVYGCKLWRQFGEGPTQIVEGQFQDGIAKNFTSRDVRYTVNGGNLYAIVMKESKDGQYALEALGDRDASSKPNFHGLLSTVKLLGSDQPVAWTRDENALHLKAPVLHTENPIVFRIPMN